MSRHLGYEQALKIRKLRTIHGKYWVHGTVGRVWYGVNISITAKLNSNSNNKQQNHTSYSSQSPLKTSNTIKIAQQTERAHVCIFGIWSYIFIVILLPHINSYLSVMFLKDRLCACLHSCSNSVTIFFILSFYLSSLFHACKEALFPASLHTFTISLGQMGVFLYNAF